MEIKPETLRKIENTALIAVVLLTLAGTIKWSYVDAIRILLALDQNPSYQRDQVLRRVVGDIESAQYELTPDARVGGGYLPARPHNAKPSLRNALVQLGNEGSIDDELKVILETMPNRSCANIDYPEDDDCSYLFIPARKKLNGLNQQIQTRRNQLRHDYAPLEHDLKKSFFSGAGLLAAGFAVMYLDGKRRRK